MTHWISPCPVWTSDNKQTKNHYYSIGRASLYISAVLPFSYQEELDQCEYVFCQTLFRQVVPVTCSDSWLIVQGKAALHFTTLLQDVRYCTSLLFTGLHCTTLVKDINQCFSALHYTLLYFSCTALHYLAVSATSRAGLVHCLWPAHLWEAVTWEVTPKLWVHPV